MKSLRVAPVRTEKGCRAIQKCEANEALLEQRLDDLCHGLREAIDHVVETLRREGVPTYVSENGNVVDLQLAPQLE